mmetsp:Transcript_4058/g.9685  ORF Transcript_4058/g.9685 Transcript_4058/m.9685 type:complete len:216 (+) Transcript_4058:126-773(+)
MRKSLANSASLLWNKRKSVDAFGSALSTMKPPIRDRQPLQFRALERREFSAGVSDRGGAIIQGSSGSIHLPPADDPVGLQLYKKAVYCPQSGILRTSAHVGTDHENKKADRIVGDSVDPKEAKVHAFYSGLRLLATLHQALDGDLGRVEQVLHLRGMVKSTPDFSGHASVVDGCSEILQQALGPDVGVGTRECFGVGSLGATVACTLEVRVAPPG